jgi:4-hydroxy-3-polyprenylbenzoate decarboxylase
MPYASLAEFLEELTQHGELARVAVEVDFGGELAEICRRLIGQSGPAALFAQVRGCHFPVAANLLASESRLCRAMDVASLSEIAQRLSEPPSATSAGWMDALRRFPSRGNGTRFEPRQIKNAACQQVVRLGSDVHLHELPLAEESDDCQAAVVVAQSYDRGERAMEVCLLKRGDRQRLSLAWQPTGSLHRLASDHQRRSQPMPVAILLGGHPIDWIAALAPQPLAGDPWHLAGMLRGRALEVARLRTLELDAPADAEIVLEGALDTAPPMGDAVGGVEIGAVTHRANPVAVTLRCGEPLSELSLLTAAVQRMFLPQFKQLLPELVDFGFPHFAGGRVATVAIQKTYAGQAQKAARLLWGLGVWPDVRLLVVVDEGVDVQDGLQASRLLASADFEHDMQSHRGPTPAHLSRNNDSATEPKWTLDATTPLPGESAGHRSRLTRADAATVAHVTRRWSEYGLPPAS